MKMKNKKTEKRLRIKRKIKMKISGTSERPRLTVFRSNKFIYAQLIDDVKMVTLAQASDSKITKGTKMSVQKKSAKQSPRLVSTKGSQTLCLTAMDSSILVE